MLSKKNLMMGLLALGSVFSALSMGCTGVTQTMELMVDVYDITGAPLTTYFDYYLDIYTTDGVKLTYHNDGQQTDINGSWNFSEPNLTFYTDPNGVQCQDTCVAWDAYGCTDFASDCWSTTDVYNLDTNMIASTAAAIGIDFGSAYAIYNHPTTLSSFTPNAVTFVQHDQFDTNIVVLGGAASARSQSHGPAAPSSLSLSSDKPLKGGTRTGKPNVIKDLSTLTPAQMDLVKKSRQLFGRPSA